MYDCLFFLFLFFLLSFDLLSDPVYSWLLFYFSFLSCSNFPCIFTAFRLRSWNGFVLFVLFYLFCFHWFGMPWWKLQILGDIIWHTSRNSNDCCMTFSNLWQRFEPSVGNIEKFTWVFSLDRAVFLQYWNFCS